METLKTWLKPVIFGIVGLIVMLVILLCVIQHNKGKLQEEVKMEVYEITEELEDIYLESDTLNISTVEE